MFPYLIREYVVRYKLMVNKIRIHDEDNEVLKRFDHESLRKTIYKNVNSNKLTNRPCFIIRTSNSFP